MKRDKRSTMTANMEPLNAFVDEAERVSDIRLEFKSDIHLRITVNRRWTDFWPTTGKWYDSSTSKKGTDVRSLVEFLKGRCGMQAPKPTPKPSGTHQPSIRERLAIIDLQVAAIRAELFPKEDSPAPEPLPSYMQDELDIAPAKSAPVRPNTTPPPAPSKTSYGSVSELLAEVEDDDPPWNP